MASSGTCPLQSPGRIPDTAEMSLAMQGALRLDDGSAIAKKAASEIGTETGWKAATACALRVLSSEQTYENDPEAFMAP